MVRSAGARVRWSSIRCKSGSTVLRDRTLTDRRAVAPDRRTVAPRTIAPHEAFQRRPASDGNRIAALS